ncbi:MAG: DUF1080 domain-containing protein [Saprospiraceae bacterium]
MHLLPNRLISLLLPLLLCCGTLISLSGQQTAPPWQELFNGTDFSGFTALNGKAPFHYDSSGAVVGTAVLNSPNTFLSTDDNYGDFILEYELWNDPRLNSGVQFRSLSKPDYQDGRVHGYQADADPSPRGWSGGIYDEGRRGWIYPLTRYQPARAASVTGQWNHYRIEAVGPIIRTWVNGQMAANLVDDRTATGFIGFQVHGISEPEQEGTLVKWRNVRIITDRPERFQRAVDPRVPEVSYLVNQLTESEERRGFRLLWDGNTWNGWEGQWGSALPGNQWEIANGVLTSKSKFAAIKTDRDYGDFELILDFNIRAGTTGGGIHYLMEMDTGQTTTGLVYQLADDQRRPQGEGDHATVGSLRNLIPAQNLYHPERDEGYNGPDRWNQARIVVHDGRVEHWLNQQEIVEYDRDSQVFSALLGLSDYGSRTDLANRLRGAIVLTAGTETTQLRSIRIREF